MLFAGWEVRIVKNCDRGHASVTVTVVRDRKIRTALRTNQIAEFITMTAWKKIKDIVLAAKAEIIIRKQNNHRKQQLSCLCS